MEINQTTTTTSLVEQKGLVALYDESKLPFLISCVVELIMPGRNSRGLPVFQAVLLCK